MQTERQCLNEVCESLCNEYEDCLKKRVSKRAEFDEQSKIMQSLLEFHSKRSSSFDKAVAQKRKIENICYTMQAQRNNAFSLIRKYKDRINPGDISSLKL